MKRPLNRMLIAGVLLTMGLGSAIAESANMDNGLEKSQIEKVELSDMHPRDAELARKIRERISQDGAVAWAAKKIEIYASQGRVTLSGKVQSEFDKNTVEKIATVFAGDLPVNDQLTVDE